MRNGIRVIAETENMYQSFTAAMEGDPSTPGDGWVTSAPTNITGALKMAGLNSPKFITYGQFKKPNGKKKQVQHVPLRRSQCVVNAGDFSIYLQQ